jgi:hypothetical protein
MAHDLQRLGEARLDLGLVADIDDLGVDLATVALQFLAGVCILPGVGAPDADVGAGLCKCIGHAETDAAIAAGDQRHLARQIEALVGHASPLPHILPVIRGRPIVDSKISGSWITSKQSSIAL